MSAVKIFGWTGMREGKQTREIIATTSWIRAADASNQSVGMLRKYGAISSNTEEIDIARRFPGVVCWRSLDGSHKRGEGWFLHNGDPVVVEFNREHAKLLRWSYLNTQTLQDAIEHGDGWPELRAIEFNILAAAAAMGIPRDVITGPSS